MQDSIAQRDTGWIQFYCLNNQEVLDQVIFAYKVAEKLLIPVMVCFDGFRLSHTMMPVEVPSEEKVDAFLTPYTPKYTIDPDRPVNINPVVMGDPIPDGEGILSPSYMGFRHRLQERHEEALQVIATEGRAFADAFGRSYEEPLVRYQADDADVLCVTMGSLASEAFEAVDAMREEGQKVGVIGLRVYRPFPARQLAQAVSRAQTIIVMEKAISYGYEGALATELKAALFSFNGHRPDVYNFIFGLGGKDVKPADVAEATRESLQLAENRIRLEHPRWFGYGI
jgi:pyruvate/2-oxoacid:ferredoxin oxidoreductase alpha subunit